MGQMFGGGGMGSGITDINSDLTASQTLSVGSAGTDFAITDAGSGSHVFNLPSASASNRGAITTGAQTIAGRKTFSLMPVFSSAGAIATNATDGFLYIPTCAGTPTGVPTAVTGNVALVFDSTNNKICVYDGGWLSTIALL